MAPTLFRLLLVAVVVYALVRGGRDERSVAAICVLGAIFSELVYSPIQQRFDDLEMGVMLVDLGVFAGFLAVALRSHRFWPLWVAGLQLTTTLGHFLKGVDSALLPQAYGAALVFWAYPIVVILAIGTWRASKRRELEPGTA